MKKTVYFDNAATTFPKPEAVYRRADRFARKYAGNPGRASHQLALSAAEEVYSARNEIAELFSARPERVAFTVNTTSALNIAIKGVVESNEHVLISSMEHNSVLRPVNAVCRERGSGYSMFNVANDDDETLFNVRSAIKKNTKTLICTHMSNILPMILPVRRIGELCREKGITFIVDGAQSAGALPIDMEKDFIDVLCVPGHKGLYGYQGCGALIFGSGFERCLRTLIEGGSGTESVPVDMPDYLPDRFEAGTLPTVAISALAEGVRFVKSKGVDAIYKHESSLCGYIREQLSIINGLTIYNDSDGPMLLFNVESLSPATMAMKLAEAGICVRSGLHCAPLAHKSIGTLHSGAVRLGFGVFNTKTEADYFCDTVRFIVKNSKL